jgi:hypothetical protein
MNITVSLWIFLALCLAAWWGFVSILLAFCIAVQDWRNSKRVSKE